MQVLLSCIILIQCIFWTQSMPVIPPNTPATTSAIDLAMSHLFQDVHSHTHNAINPFSNPQSAQCIQDLIQSETFGSHIRHLFQSCVSRYRGTVAQLGASELAIKNEIEQTSTEIADSWTTFANSFLDSVFADRPENRESVLSLPRESAHESSRHEKRGIFDQLAHVERQSSHTKPVSGSTKRRMVAIEDRESEQSSQDAFHTGFQSNGAHSMDEVSSFYFPSSAQEDQVVPSKPWSAMDPSHMNGQLEQPKHLSHLPIEGVSAGMKRSKASWNLVALETEAIMKEEIKSILVQPIAHALKDKSKPILSWLLHQVR